MFCIIEEAKKLAKKKSQKLGDCVSDENRQMEDLKKFANKLPKHIGLIPDGNRRWARRNNVSRNAGHLAGYETLKNNLLSFFEAGIRYLTVYALSLENARKRSADELEYLYKIIKLGVETVKNEPIVKDEKVRFNVIGRLELLPLDVRKKIDELIEYTKHHDQAFVNILIMYDGQEEIVDGIKKIIKDKVDPKKINCDLVKSYLYTKNFPEVDYVIRTGMEDGARISGFLLWDTSYAELKFRNQYWPDYNEDLIIEDLYDYIIRNRRKGQ
ncbi:MAG: polyprenyl diphosphate synthase [Promethearchaeota archaeon]